MVMVTTALTGTAGAALTEQQVAAFCDVAYWRLNDTMVQLPFLPEPVSVNSSPFIKRFPTFIPSNGTIEYDCSDDDGNGSMRVRAFLESNPAQGIAGRNKEADTFFYEGEAKLHAHNSTVIHIVDNTNRDEYMGRELIRAVSFTDSNVDNANLLLTPKEKVNGVAFALLWTPVVQD